jgi:hypothetical protein
MLTVSQYVWSILSKDNIATEYLKKDLLNLTAYAKTIQTEIETQTLSKVSIGSIVTSLTRIKTKLSSNIATNPKFKIDDISLKLPISELVYQKSRNPNPELGKIYLELKNTGSVHFNIVNVEDELDIFVSSNQLDLVKNQMQNFGLILQENDLSALVLKYDPEYRNYPGMASQILNLLAINSIILVESLTTYSEFIIYIKQDFANRAVEVLKKAFMN